MIFQTPELRDDERGVLELLSEQREQLRDRVAEPRRWAGTLRRMTFARAVQGSNSIEGYNASLDDVVAAVDGEPTLDASAETQLALAGYRDAMTYVLQLARDETPNVDEGLIKSLHFMMLKYDLSKNPGQWRPGDIYVRNDASGEIVYEGPASDEVPKLIAEMLLALASDQSPVPVKAAMAHLNLVLIHPFSDGNGRMARCLQTLVLARDRVLAPVFSSIEEFLGRNTEAYYEVLAEVGAGYWHPERDARPWIRFCLRAHYLQIRTMLRRRQEIEELWNSCYALAEKSGLPERCAVALMDAAYGLRIRRGSYRASVEGVTGEDVSEQTASRDLRAMVDQRLLAPMGERRARYYLAGPRPTEIRNQVKASRPPRADEDPFAVVRDRRQLSLT
ncbi:MAG TPA: Fic family protein [Solirubrobacterales bacterium]|nr:Fic family protein [Solirubrobacterales bacterium]